MKKTITKFSGLILAALVLVVFVCPVSAAVSKVPAIKWVTLSKTAVTISAGSKYQLTVKILPINASEKAIKWSTTNTNIAAVNQSGIVTGKKEGKALISAKSSNNKYGSCAVTVSATHAVTIKKLDYAQYKKNCGSQYKIIGNSKIKITPSSADCETYVDVSDVQQYAGKDLTAKFYINGVLSKDNTGYQGSFGKGDKTELTGFGLSAYLKNGYYWLTPATYKIGYYAAGHQFRTITFKVNEFGFC